MTKTSTGFLSSISDKSYKTNIVLIGMPGVGKSTLGVVLAKHLAKDFVDTDLLIQNRYRCSLQDQLDQYGYEVLRQREQSVLLSTHYTHTVIATGGSAVYGDAAMKHLAKEALIVYLEASQQTLLSRINNMGSRGIACPQGQSFDDLYQERIVLYQHYADVVIPSNENTAIEETMALLLEHCVI